MKIAVTYEAGQVFQHFGHTPAFKVYTVEGGKIVSEQVVPTAGSGHGALAGFLENLGVSALICGGIGGGARFALQDADIEIYGGVSGDADEAALALAEGRLDFNPNASCGHHHHGEGHSCGHHHHEEGHTCGHHHHEEGHSCGHHGCGHHHD